MKTALHKAPGLLVIALNYHATHLQIILDKYESYHYLFICNKSLSLDLKPKIIYVVIVVKIKGSQMEKIFISFFVTFCQRQSGQDMNFKQTSNSVMCHFNPTKLWLRLL